MANEDEIILLNNRNHVLWDVLVDCFNIEDDAQYSELSFALNEFKKFLTTKNIKYSDLRKLLFPGATLFAYVVNSNYYHSCENYGTPLGLCILKSLGKKSNAIFLMGDYLVENQTAAILKGFFEEKGVNVSDWHDATPYYIFLVSGITKKKADEINAKCKEVLGFCGMINLTLQSKLKFYLCHTIPQKSIKLGNRLLFSVPDGEEQLGLNYSGFDEEVGLEFIAIPESYYLFFCTARYFVGFESINEINLSLKAINPKLEFNNDFSINITDDKLLYVNGHLGNKPIKREWLTQYITEKLQLYQIYRMSTCEGENNSVIKFCIPLYNNEYVSNLVLKWNFDENTISLITISPI